MRIGTWNMEGRAGGAQVAFLEQQACDVLLLTEVAQGLSLPGYHLTQRGHDMLPGKWWAVVAAREPLVECPCPHPAAAAAVVGGTTYVSSVLPWRGSGGADPWNGDDHSARMTAALDELVPFLRKQTDLVWGGDWNQSLAGPEQAGSRAGRQALLALLEELKLSVPTAGLSHPLEGLLSIDHVGVRGGATEARRVVASHNGVRLSDHDFYVVVT